MLDSDLARLYGTTTTRMNQAVRRNLERFPPDFMFQLTAAERDEVVTNCDNLRRLKFSPSLPYAFTEHGAVMAATVLNSPKAVEVSVFVVRAFIQQRAMLAAHAELALRQERMEKRLLAALQLLDAHDAQIDAILEALRELMTPPPAPARSIGFRPGEEAAEE